ncbi:TPA: FAD-dependent oxidoreductase [Candidatus Gastranaerophilales bacterium HUM_23]|nr:MAG TPA: FAD-dependent oxidoreductase [Candidatus Gastranaerophilales bacterium HUM_17]DAB24948.1 MAG TPA: FAD-dependent oxidoreductase [Candidatus Gastranaerophilales bacterium HUM_23]
MYNVAIIGAGPAGIFSALEIIKLRPEWKVILIEKGQKIEKRKCPIREGSPKCVNCKRCGLLCGWGGAGAFSDGKLTLTPDVGGHLVDYMSREKVEQLIKYADNMYLEHGATDEVFGTDMEVFREIEREAALAELKLVHSPVRHLGTERSLDVLKHMQDFLDERITILNNVTAQSLIVECEQVKGIVLDNGETIKAQYTIIAPGREGADWLTHEFAKNKIGMVNNAVDIGVRVELPAPVFAPLTDKLYESKLVYYSPTFGDEVRTFCMNPNGEVVQENYNGIATVNGHSYANIKTNNTNFALLVSKKFTEPFKEPIAYGQHIASLANMLAGGILVQRFGDLLEGRRSTPDRIKSSIITPTLSCATPGDLSLVIPYRQMKSIIEMLFALDKIAPGTSSRYTLLYGIEVKFYSARVKLTNELETEGVKNLFTIGDGAGVTRGLIQASASGVYVAQTICARG